MLMSIPVLSENIVRHISDVVLVRSWLRIFAVGMAGLHIWAAVKSQSMNADGISYLDIGDAYFRGDWENAINPVWSPLYSWILGFANFLIRPSMEWEFTVVHLINFLVFIGTLASFEFMWREVRSSRAIADDPGSIPLPNWLWWILGYLLFIWTSLSLIQIWSVTPDMLMAAFVFLAAGLTARIRAGDERLRLFMSLGLVLGLGYLSKTFMFSIALVFLGLVWLLQKGFWKSLVRTGLAVVVFLLVSLPFILLISEKKGKLTIGEAGTVTYVRYVNGIPFPHWQGDPFRGFVPTHPSRIVHQSPAVYEFGEPLGGTYPISTDPSYWYEGIEPRFEPKEILARLFASSLVYMDIFFRDQGLLLACVLALYIVRKTQRYSFLGILHSWLLVIPAVVAFGLYGLVLVAGRYIGVFILLFWTDILANIRLPDVGKNRSWIQTLGSVAAIGLLANILLFNLDGFKQLNSALSADLIQQTAPPARPLAVAQTLVELGINPGDRVGVIGYAYDSFWARLARVKIVAEMSEEAADRLWSGDEVLRASVLQSFANSGADAVVAEFVPAAVELQGWHQVGESSYFIYRFEE